MKNTVYAVRPQGFGLPKFSHNRLTGLTECPYAYRIAAKSAIGIGLPFNHKAHSRQLFAGFFVRTICTPACNSLGELHPNYGGLVEGASAHRFLVYGKTNLDQSTTSRLVSACGGFKNLHKEAVIMATTPTQAVTTAMIYTFIVAGGVRALSDIKRIRTVSLVAQSEPLARKQLSGLPLVFVSRTPNRSMGVSA